MDNRWVVPYNPYLTRRYKCHINVEVCSSIKVIKYLYKYIYKGRPSPLSLTALRKLIVRHRHRPGDHGGGLQPG